MIVKLIGGPMDGQECEESKHHWKEIQFAMPLEHAGNHPAWINAEGIATRPWPQYRYVLQSDGSYRYGGTI